MILGEFVFLQTIQANQCFSLLLFVFRWKGENVATAEVEAVISNVSELNDAIVYGVEVSNVLFIVLAFQYNIFYFFRKKDFVLLPSISVCSLHELTFINTKTF